MPSRQPAIVFIGGGPRTAGILERLAANRPQLFGGPLTLHVVEPHEPGSGRIWRYDQDPGLLLNSTAADVTLFTDASVHCEGPVFDGPGLYAWAAGILDGTIRDVPVFEPHIVEQLRSLTGSAFPSRQVQSKYLEWFFRRSVASLGPDTAVTVHRTLAVGVDTAVGVDRSAGGSHDHAAYSVRLANGASIDADFVVYALGHTDSLPGLESKRFSEFADRHGGFHAAPSYTTDVDYSPLATGQDVIVSGLGLAFVDLLVLLMEGRGGRFTPNDDGGLDYLPSGREPRIWAGSRRGVPYHSKISSTLRGAPTDGSRYLTEAAVASLLAAHEELDFRDHLWPLIAKDAGYAYYRELFAGYPERVRGAWSDFEERFEVLEWYSRAREDLVAAAVPDAALRLDLEALDQPFSGCAFPDHEHVQEAIAAYIRKDLALRTSPDHSETLALFAAFLRVYMDIGRLVPQERLNAQSQQAVHGWWHGFFSFVDSGPPPHRLQQMLALQRSGLLNFLGPSMWVRTDESTGRFVAGSFQSPVIVDAAAYIEARLPAPSVARSANPALAHLHDAGWGTEQRLLTAEGPHSTGRLLITAGHEVAGPDGARRPGLFAVGPGTSGWGAGAFARPGTNAAPFRENDALARRLLVDAAAVASGPVGQTVTA